MPIKYLYKCNPKVAEAIGLTTFDRYHWPDGTMLLWSADLEQIDRVRFYTDNANFLADLGAVQMTDPEAFQEQQNPSIRLPEARLPKYRWEQPDFSATINDERSTMNADSGDFHAEDAGVQGAQGGQSPAGKPADASLGNGDSNESEEGGEEV